MEQGKPPILDVDIYPFRGDSQWGGTQDELDTLSRRLERAYQAGKSAIGGPIDLHFTGQASALWDESGGHYDFDYPSRADILAETFIALAHGAKGINFFKYRSFYSTKSGDSTMGIVDLNGSRANPPFSIMYKAVHGVFTYLDSVGDILLTLERDTAYCVYTDNITFGSELLPITNIEFEDDDEDYIEVGQFHTTQGDTDYVIIVNRRTDADRHINIIKSSGNI